MRGAAAAWIVAVLAASPAAARFAPATDASYRLAIVTTREDARGVRRFASDYAIAFTRVAGGYRATIRLLPDSVSDGGGDDRLLRLQRATTGDPLTIRLDGQGRLLGVEEAGARWAALRQAIEAVTLSGRGTVLAAHDRLSATARDRILAADLLALCAGAETDRRDGTRETTLPASEGAPLPVRETVRRAGDTVTIVTEGAGGAVASFHRRQDVDRRTGLVRDAEERRRTVAMHDGVTATETLTHRRRLTPMVSYYPSPIARKP